MDNRLHFLPRRGVIITVVAAIALLLVGLLAYAPAQGQVVPAANDAGLGQQAVLDAGARLDAATAGTARVTYDRATGVARFVTIGHANALNFDAASPEAAAAAFLATHGDLFGIVDANVELVLTGVQTDDQGMTHLTYQQMYQSVPVFAGLLRVHLNESLAVTGANGVFIPGIALDGAPILSAADAGQLAVDTVRAQDPTATAATVAHSDLFVYHDGLIKGVPGTVRLVFEVEVAAGVAVRENVYVDAYDGVVVNQISLIHEAMFRRLYEGDLGNEVWAEGDAFPGALDIDQQNILTATEDTYDLFFNAFGFDSWDAAGAEMLSVNNDPTINCPNANWNGVSTNYCTGVTGDDTVAHEWGHAYTDSTHNLIYQWQSGALNESYSDIWGETVDFINGWDVPDTLRSANECSVYGGAEPPTFEVNSPGDIAGFYPVGGAAFNPAAPLVVTNDIVLVNDGDSSDTNGDGIPGTPTDGCTALTNGSEVNGKIAIVDRGDCNFTVKVINAQNEGAIGVIVVNNVGNQVINMGGGDPLITIPSVFMGQDNGQIIKDRLLTATVNGTIDLGSPGTDNSYRWLSGENDPAFNGAIRDMWHPNCFGDPGKVTDAAQYVCDASDGGGVHTNSGIPNHAYALLVDGGTYNSVTVSSIGFVKAAHIYWRAQLLYQGPATDFPEHADALETACDDLRVAGTNLTGFDGLPSGQVISAGDCTEVADAIAAVELRSDPDFCAFEPLLDPMAPTQCAGFGSPASIYADDWEDGTASDWTFTNAGVYAEYDPVDWVLTTATPGDTVGTYVMFAVDGLNVGDCTPGSDDQSGVKRIESPSIAIPSNVDFPVLSFDHWVATEFDYDGGNVKISVNNGAWQTFEPSDFVFNPYNGQLAAGPGNTNPLESQWAFHGSNGGVVSGSWGQTQLNLGRFATGGDNVRIRFDFGVDGCNGLIGWYVDEVEVYTCTAFPETSLPIVLND